MKQTLQYKSKPLPANPIYYLPNRMYYDEMNQTAADILNVNCLAHYLTSKLEITVASVIIGKYGITNSKYHTGATMLWQRDVKNNVRAGLSVLYNHTTGDRVLYPSEHFYWVHTDYKNPNFVLKQCFFGEHLLNSYDNVNKPVAIFKSEFAAIMGSVYLPGYVCIAAGTKSGLNIEKCNVLIGRAGVLYPSNSDEYENWHKAQTQISGLKRFEISNYFLKVNQAG